MKFGILNDFKGIYLLLLLPTAPLFAYKGEFKMFCLIAFLILRHMFVSAPMWISLAAEVDLLSVQQCIQV